MSTQPRELAELNPRKQAPHSDAVIRAAALDLAAEKHRDRAAEVAFRRLRSAIAARLEREPVTTADLDRCCRELLERLRR